MATKIHIIFQIQYVLRRKYTLKVEKMSNHSILCTLSRYLPLFYINIGREYIQRKLKEHQAFKCSYSLSLNTSPFSNSNWNFLRLNLGLFLWIMRWKYGLVIMMFVESLFCERVKFQCGGPRQRYRHTRRQSSRR